MRMLIVEDDDSAARLLADALASTPGAIERAGTMREALEAADRDPFSLVIADLILPDGDGIALTKELKARDASTEIVILTGQSSVETAVAAMTAGARTYLKKPVSLEELRAVVAKCAEVAEMRRELTRLSAADGAARILGESAAMRRLREEILTVAPSAMPVLIFGESGTGKDLVAHALHHHSGRRGSFIAINAAAIAPTIIESELFGHVRGAFTGAIRDHAGCFERADGGTLFLDEIGELPFELQPKFLRAMESAEVLRVGGERPRPVDVRLVAATNRDLRGAVRDERFRRDLFHRLSVATIEIPPLRERPEDIAPLAGVFLRRASEAAGRSSTAFDADALELLEQHEFPGNARELKNVVEAALLFCRGERISAAEVKRRLDIMSERGDEAKLSTGSWTVESALKKSGGNRRRAAELLGITERTLYRHMKRLGLS